MLSTGTKFDAGIEQQRLTSLIISTVVLGTNSQPCNHFMLYTLRQAVDSLLLAAISHCGGYPLTKRMMALRYKVDPDTWCGKCKRWVDSQSLLHQHLY